MNRIKTLLADDEPRGLSSLKKLLEFNCPELEIVATCSSADEAKEKISNMQTEAQSIRDIMKKETKKVVVKRLAKFGQKQ